jgi:osmoprotectant transport system substrate-binding protein
MKTSRWVALLLMLVAALALGACGDDDDDDGGSGDATSTEQAPASSGIQKDDANASTTITVGSKNFTEQKILGEIYAQALTAAGFTVKKDLNLGDEKIAFKAIQSDQINAYPEYTGTALLSLFGVEADKLPTDPKAAFDQTKFAYAGKGMTAFDPTPYTNSNEVAVTQETADKYSLKTISDLKPVADKLTLYGTPECRQRLDCLLGLEQVYGLKFKKFTPVDPALRHEVLTNGQADVSIVFTTDPQIAREKFVLLEDDKQMFPPYNTTFVVRNEIAEKGGASLKDAVDQATEGLTDEVMQELNARVDLDKKTPEVVAGEYLSESGLVQN